MRKSLIFADGSFEKKFRVSRRHFHLKIFKILSLALILQSVSIYIANPLELNLLVPKYIISLIISLVIPPASYVIISKKKPSYSSTAIAISVTVYTIGIAEFINGSKAEGSTNTWTFFLLGINIQAGCMFILASRIRWLYCLLIIAVVHFYAWIRIVDFVSIDAAQKSALISLVIHIFLQFLISYSSEREDRILFNRMQAHIDLIRGFEGLVKDNAQNSIIITKGEEILFFNETTRREFYLNSEVEVQNMLNSMKIVHKNKQFHLFSQSSMIDEQIGLQPTQAQTLMEYIRNNITPDDGEKVTSRINLLNVEGELAEAGQELGHSYAIQVRSIVWKGKKSTMISLTDITSIKNQYVSMDIYKNDLLNIAAHSVRTPLQALIGLTKISNHQVPSELPIKENLRFILISAKIVLSVINDISDFAHIMMGRLRLNFESVKICSFLEETVKIMSLQAELKGLHIVVENSLKSKNDIYILDPNRLRQVLFNLISNAIKYTTKGLIHVRLREELTDSLEGPMIPNQTSPDILGRPRDRHLFTSSKFILKKLIFEIEDTGIGISRSRINTLFGMAKMGDPHGTATSASSGLGLIISHALVNIMNSFRLGAEIKVTSNEGAGSLFSFPLFIDENHWDFLVEGVDSNRCPKPFEAKPLNLQREPEIQSLNTNFSEAEFLIKGNNKPLKILVVDYEPIKLSVTLNYLQSVEDEFLVETATSSHSAIEKVKEASKCSVPFQMILLECQMPIIDGFEIARGLKLMMTRNAVHWAPIIGISGKSLALPKEKQKFVSNGLDACLYMPFDRKELMEKIKEALKSR